MSASIQGQFRLHTFKDYVPHAIRPWLYLLFAVIYQTSGAIYFAAIANMHGSLSLLEEDIKMCGFASFIGMNVAFPLLFKFKFRFTNRTMIIFCITILILCNLAIPYVNCIPLLVFIALVAGFVRMWMTFETFSTIQLWMTPVRDFSIFFPIIYAIILGAINTTGIITAYICHFATWEYMYYFVLILLFSVLLFFFITTKHWRFMSPLPLYGIDWTGLILWTVFQLSVVFSLFYGEHYGWFESGNIRFSVGVSIVALGLNLWRMTHIRHPYISMKLFKAPNIFKILLIFLILEIMLSAPDDLQSKYMFGILHFDSLNIISLNWLVLIGIFIGCAISYLWLHIYKYSFKRLVYLGFAFVLIYIINMYLIISPDTNIESLYFLSFVRGAGLAIMYVSVTVYLEEIIAFEFFFQGLCVLGIIRSGIGGAAGTGLYGYAMRYCMEKNVNQLGSYIDGIRQFGLSYENITNQVYNQAMLISLKEIYGYIALLGFAFLLIMMIYDTDVKKTLKRMPLISDEHNIVKQTIKRFTKNKKAQNQA